MMKGSQSSPLEWVCTEREHDKQYDVIRESKIIIIIIIVSPIIHHATTLVCQPIKSKISIRNKT